MTQGLTTGERDGGALQTLTVGGDVVDVPWFVAVSAGAQIAVDRTVVRKMERAASVLSDLLDRGEPVYGVTTGYGSALTSQIAPSQRLAVQVATLRSHACGSGPPLSKEIARGVWLAKLCDLSSGCSGASPALVERLASYLNLGIAPVIPESGSLGASGDLVPSAHAALPLIGEGQVMSRDGRILPTAAVLLAEGIEPLQLGVRDGLSLVNGTATTTSLAVHACSGAGRYLATAARCAVASLEAFGGHVEAYDEAIVAARPQLGARRVIEELAAGLVGWSADSARQVALHDPYAWRCVPQVHGAAYAALDWVERACEIELSSCSDNPILGSDDRFVSGGNFHAGPLGVPLDALALALHEVGALSRARLVHLRDTLDARGAGGPGLTMVLTSATASLFRAASFAPATGHSLPIDEMEDHVSNATAAGRQVHSCLEALYFCLAAEAFAIAILERATARPPLSAAGRQLSEIVFSLVSEPRLDVPLSGVLDAIASALREPK